MGGREGESREDRHTLIAYCTKPGRASRTTGEEGGRREREVCGREGKERWSWEDQTEVKGRKEKGRQEDRDRIRTA